MNSPTQEKTGEPEEAAPVADGQTGLIPIMPGSRRVACPYLHLFFT